MTYPALSRLIPDLVLLACCLMLSIVLCVGIENHVREIFEEKSPREQALKKAFSIANA